MYHGEALVEESNLVNLRKGPGLAELTGGLHM
jgi:hypothetical protein